MTQAPSAESNESQVKVRPEKELPGFPSRDQPMADLLHHHHDE